MPARPAYSITANRHARSESELFLGRQVNHGARRRVCSSQFSPSGVSLGLAVAAVPWMTEHSSDNNFPTLPICDRSVPCP